MQAANDGVDVARANCVTDKLSMESPRAGIYQPYTAILQAVRGPVATVRGGLEDAWQALEGSAATPGPEGTWRLTPG